MILTKEKAKEIKEKIPEKVIYTQNGYQKYLVCNGYEELIKKISKSKNPEFFEYCEGWNPMPFFIDIDINNEKSEPQLEYSELKQQGDKTVLKICSEFTNEFDRFANKIFLLESHDTKDNIMKKYSVHILIRLYTEEMKEVLFPDAMVLKQYVESRFSDKTKFVGVDLSVYKIDGFLFRTYGSSKPKQKRYLKPYHIEGIKTCERPVHCFFVGYHNLVYTTVISDNILKEQPNNEDIFIEDIDKKETKKSLPISSDNTPINLTQNILSRLCFNILTKRGVKDMTFDKYRKINECYYMDVKCICVFKNEYHKINHLYFEIRSKNITLKCHDIECKNKKELYTYDNNNIDEKSYTLLFGDPNKYISLSPEYIKTNDLNVVKSEYTSYELKANTTSLMCLPSERQISLSPNSLSMSCEHGFTGLDNSINRKNTKITKEYYQQNLFNTEHTNNITNIVPTIHNSTVINGQTKDTEVQRRYNTEGDRSARHKNKLITLLTDTIDIRRAIKEPILCELLIDYLTFKDIIIFVDLLRKTNLQNTLKVSHKDFYIKEDKIWVNYKQCTGPVKGLLKRHISQFLEPIQRFVSMNHNVHLSKLSKLYALLTNNSFISSLIEQLNYSFKDNDFWSKLDSDDNKLPFNNGVYLIEEKQFRNYDDTDFFSYIIPYKYEYLTNYDKINQILEKIFIDENERFYVYKLLASFLRPSKTGEYVYFFRGSGANEKSLLANLLINTLGEFAINMPSSFFAHDPTTRKSANLDIMSLKRVRLGVVSESTQKDFKTELIKRMMGHDKKSGSGLHSNIMQTFRINTKIIVLVNTLPTFPNDDEALWRRIVVVEFKTRFMPLKALNPYERVADKSLRNQIENDKNLLNQMMQLMINNYDPSFDPFTTMPATYKENLKVFKGVYYNFVEWLRVNLSIDMECNEIITPNAIIEKFYFPHPLPDFRKQEYKIKLGMIDTYLSNLALEVNLKNQNLNHVKKLELILLSKVISI